MIVGNPKHIVDVVLTVFVVACYAFVAIMEVRHRKRRKEFDARIAAMSAEIEYHEQLVRKYNYVDLMYKLRVITSV
jgi:hypothetical protein